MSTPSIEIASSPLIGAMSGFRDGLVDSLARAVPDTPRVMVEAAIDTALDAMRRAHPDFNSYARALWMYSIATIPNWRVASAEEFLELAYAAARYAPCLEPHRVPDADGLFDAWGGSASKEPVQ